MTATATRTTQLVRCDVGALSVGLVMDGVDGVERADRVRPAADRPDLCGLLPARGGDRPVYRLADRLGVPDGGTSRTGQVVLLTSPAGTFGVKVDRVSPVFRLPQSAVRECPLGFGPRERGLFAGVALHDAAPLLLLNPDALAGDHLADPPPDEPARGIFPPASDRLLVFDVAPDERFGGRPVGFGIPAGWVTEVAEVGALTPVPGADHLGGLTAWRDQPVAVADLGAWVGLRPVAETTRRAVAVRTARGVIAFAAAGGAKMVNAATPHAPSRRAWPVRTDRLLAAVEFDTASVLIPDYHRFVGSAAGVREPGHIVTPGRGR